MGVSDLETFAEENQNVCEASSGVHYFTQLTDDKHLQGREQMRWLANYRGIHNFTLFAAPPGPAPRQSVVDERSPQIMDWDVDIPPIRYLLRFQGLARMFTASLNYQP